MAIFISMNIRKIIKEEISDFDWADDIDDSLYNLRHPQVGMKFIDHRTPLFNNHVGPAAQRKDNIEYTITAIHGDIMYLTWEPWRHRTVHTRWSVRSYLNMVEDGNITVTEVGDMLPTRRSR